MIISRATPWRARYEGLFDELDEARAVADEAIRRENARQTRDELGEKASNLASDIEDSALDLRDDILNHVPSEDGKREQKNRRKAAKERAEAARKRDKSEPTLLEALTGDEALPKKVAEAESRLRLDLYRGLSFIHPGFEAMADDLATLRQDATALPGSSAFAALEGIWNQVGTLLEHPPDYRSISKQTRILADYKLDEVYPYRDVVGHKDAVGIEDIISEYKDWLKRAASTRKNSKKFITRFQGTGSYESQHQATIDSLRTGQLPEVDWDGLPEREGDSALVDSASADTGDSDRVLEFISVDDLLAAARGGTKTKLEDHVVAEIRTALEAAIRKGRKADSDDERRQQAVEVAELTRELLAANTKLKEKHLDNLYDQLITRVTTLIVNSMELTPEQVAETQALLSRGLKHDATRELAHEIVSAGRAWPFGPLHFLWRLNANYAAKWHGASDIFTLVAEELVDYFFFRQDVVSVHRTGVPALQKAEENYLKAMEGESPDAAFEVGRETGAFNFRGDRAKAMARNLSKPGGHLSMHDLGLAIDVNYGYRGDKRNPHIKNPETLEFIAFVLRESNLTSLARLDFNASTKSVETFAAMLDASKAFVNVYGKWKTNFLQSLYKPEGRQAYETIPSVKDYKKLISTMISGKDAKATLKELKELEGEELSAREAVLERLGSGSKSLVREGTKLSGRLEKCKSAAQVVALSEHAALETEVDSFLNASGSWQEAIAQGRTDDAQFDVATTGATTAVTQWKRIDDLLTAFKTKVGQAPSSAHKRACQRSIDSIFEREKTKGRRASAVATLESTRLLMEEYDKRASATAVLTQDDLRMDPIRDARKATDHLRVLELYHRQKQAIEGRNGESLTSGFTDGIAKNGFADHPLEFPISMHVAGWTWGATFSSPDFHHFEYRSGARKGAS